MRYYCAECSSPNVCPERREVDPFSEYTESVCASCDQSNWICNYCAKAFSRKFRKRGRVRDHVVSCKKKRKSETPIETLETDSIRFHNDDDGGMLFEPEGSGITPSPDDSDDDDDPYLVDADVFASYLVSMEDEFDVTLGVDAVPYDFSTMNLKKESEIDIDSIFPDGNMCTRAYFFQERLSHMNGEEFGGIRGMAWRTLTRRKLYDDDQLLSVKDARLLLNMANHLVTEPQKSREEFFEIFDNLISAGALRDYKVEIPTSTSEANAILLEGRFGIVANLPHEDVDIKNKCAKISLVGLVRQMCAHGIPIGFTNTPGDVQSQSGGIHRTPTVKELMARMKIQSDDRRDVHRGWCILWSDGFIRSWVRQGKNNVWLLTVTFPDPEGNATSKFHTHCLAVGSSKSDKKPILDYYLEEIKKLEKGINAYCAWSKKFNLYKLVC